MIEYWIEVRKSLLLELFAYTVRKCKSLEVAFERSPNLLNRAQYTEISIVLTFEKPWLSCWVRMGSKQWISENWIEWISIADKIPYSIFTYKRITETIFVCFTVDNNDGSGIQALAFTGRLGFRSKKNDVDSNQSSNEECPEDLFTRKQMKHKLIYLHKLKLYRFDFDCSWATFKRCNFFPYFCCHIPIYIAGSRL